MNNKIEIDFQKFSYSSISDQNLKKGIDKCYTDYVKSYSPYSNFSVVATLIFEDGELISGTNQENIAFPSGICAEANVLSFSGHQFPEKKIKTIIIVGFKKEEEASFISPCGNCRQILLEFENRQQEPIEVIFGSKISGFYQFNSSQKLMPLFFSPDSTELN